MKHPEYIGISGVVSPEQQYGLQDSFEASGLTNRRVLQLGVKATHKPQILEIPNKYGPSWYPIGRQIDTVMDAQNESTAGVAQVVFDADAVHDERYRREFLHKSLGSAASTWLTGVQFDMLPWHTDDMLISSLTAHELFQQHDLTLTLQCQGEIMDTNTPEQIVERLKHYPEVDYILFDASAGRGIRMDTDRLLPYIEAVANTSELSSLGVAVGGLNAVIVEHDLPHILKYFPDISWDAEGQLHPTRDDGTHPLDMDRCVEYLQSSARVL